MTRDTKRQPHELPPDIKPLALEMKAAQDSARQIEPFTARVPGFDLATGYALAQLVHEARVKEGAKSVGRKIGFTNASLFAQYGVSHPIWGYMYDTTVVQLHDTRAVCRLGNFAQPRIEPEIVLQFRSAPRPGASPPELVDHIGWVAHGFEIVQSHFPGWKFQAPDTVADGGLHATLLIGPPQPVDRLGDDLPATLAALSVALSHDGRHIETGRGSNVLGSPLAAMAHLLSVLARQPDCVPVQAGDIVTTGTITRAYPVQAGEVWRSEVQGIDLPGLILEFA